MWTAAPGEPLAAVLARPPETLDPPLGRQAEAVSFTRDGSGLWLSSEGPEAPLHRIPLNAGATGAAATPPPPGQITDPGLAPVRTRDRSLAGPVAVAAGGVVLAGAIVALGVRRRRRR
jgi:hypothetical protein